MSVCLFVEWLGWSIFLFALRQRLFSIRSLITDHSDSLKSCLLNSHKTEIETKAFSCQANACSASSYIYAHMSTENGITHIFFNAVKMQNSISFNFVGSFERIEFSFSTFKKFPFAQNFPNDFFGEN
jgi:hypothetical protein